MTQSDPVDDGSRRVAILMVKPQLLVDVCKAGPHSFEVVENALPDDAQVVGGAYSPALGVFEIVVESRGFEPVSPGAEPPELAAPVFHSSMDRQADSEP